MHQTHWPDTLTWPQSFALVSMVRMWRQQQHKFVCNKQSKLLLLFASAYFPELRTLQWLSGCSLYLSFLLHFTAFPVHRTASRRFSPSGSWGVGEGRGWDSDAPSFSMCNQWIIYIWPIKSNIFKNQHFSQGSRYLLLLTYCSVVHSDKNTFCIRWNNSQSILCIHFNPTTKGEKSCKHLVIPKCHEFGPVFPMASKRR